MTFILYQCCTGQVNKNLVLLEVLGQTMFAGIIWNVILFIRLSQDQKIPMTHAFERRLKKNIICI